MCAHTLNFWYNLRKQAAPLEACPIPFLGLLSQAEVPYKKAVVRKTILDPPMDPPSYLLLGLYTAIAAMLTKCEVLPYTQAHSSPKLPWADWRSE